MDYIEVLIQAPVQTFEMIVAELSELGFESFEERNQELAAYTPIHQFDNLAVKAILEKYAESYPVTFTFNKINHQNWNAEWESNFQPVAMDDFLYIKAPFHPDAPGYRYHITIQPKMSFGTGHHPTTLLMIRQMALLNMLDATVLDAGTGTGILAIMAEKMGAGNVEAYDYDPICVENSAENFVLNACSHIRVYQAKAENIQYPDHHFDVVLANINRNVLQADLPIFSRLLKTGGSILLSGFYIGDVPILKAKAEELGLTYFSEISAGEWVCFRFVKE